MSYIYLFLSFFPTAETDADAALDAEIVGPYKTPSFGVISKTEGSSISGPLSLKPLTRIAVLFLLVLISTGLWVRFHFAGTSIGFSKKNIPSHDLEVWHTPKNIPGEDDVKNGSEISAWIGSCRLCPVENEIFNFPSSSAVLSPLEDADKENRKERNKIK